MNGKKEKLLGERGIKLEKDGTLNCLRKKDLIKKYRILEDNLANEIWTSDLQSARLETISKYFKTDDFNRICNEEINFDKNTEKKIKTAISYFESDEFKESCGRITEKLDNTAEYEDWLIVQEYIDFVRRRLKK